MDLTHVRRRFARHAATLRALASDLPDSAWHWRPADGGWTLLEIVAHLADEEREDFRQRIRLLLQDSNADWPPIDTERWVKQRDYASRDPDETLRDFLAERERSLAWLATLEHPDWSRTKEHPALGAISAGDLLASWLAHDVFHLRQILHRHFELTRLLTVPYSTAYAGGEW